MCVQSQLENQDTRLTALEATHNTPKDIASVMAKLTRIETYLFDTGGVPDVPRDKSGLEAV